MSRLAVALVALALGLAPLFAALPDEPTWTPWLCACVLGAGLLACVGKPLPRPQRPPPPPIVGEQEGISPAPPLLEVGGPLPPLAPAGNRTPARAFFLLLLVWALVSLVARVARQHSLAFVDTMERGWLLLAAGFATFVLAHGAARSGRGKQYAHVGAIVLAGAIASALGVNEWVAHIRIGEAGWRIFGTSTPDFLGGYLALLVPLSLALFLGAPPGRPLALLLGLMVALETVALLATQSRFGLISLAVALVTFGVCIVRARRFGFSLTPTARRRLAGMAFVVLLLGAAAARPVLARLGATGAGDNSTAFRVWTWRGAARMAEANPVLGTGIGAWVDDYPRYAEVGFTRLAHNSYLQMADECGVPGLLLLLATLGAVARAGWRGLARSLPADAPDTLAEIAPPDDRLLLCGLLASLAAGITQNLVDSDWYVFFFMLTFWGLAGLTVGTAERGTERQQAVPRALRGAAGGMAALLCVAFVAQGMGAMYASRAHGASDPAQAELNYKLAAAWQPWNGAYPSDLGYRVYARQGRLDETVTMLQGAVAREPSGVNWKRLGTLLAAQGNPALAHSAYENGLRADPLSLDLLLGLAQTSSPAEALGDYQRIALLEQSPVGQVRAIGGLTETKFAVADTMLADAARAAGNAKGAADYYSRARVLLEAYADEGGTTNPQRQALLGGRRDLNMDAQMSALYARVMDGLRQVAPAAQQGAVRKAQAAYAQKFQSLLAAP